MKLRRRMETGALAGAAIAALLAWSWRRRADSNRRALIAANLAITAAHARSVAAQHKDAALGRSPPHPAPSRPDGPPLSRQSWLQRLQSDPKLQARVLTGDRARLAIQFAPYFATQKLTPAQIRQVLDNLVEMAASQMDLQATMQDKGMTNDDPAAAQMRVRIAKEFRAAQIGVLGEEGFQQFQAFNLRSYAQSMAGNLAGIAAVAGVPLDPGQVQTLIEAIAKAQRAHPGSSDYWAAITPQAQAFLTPVQLDIVTTGEAIGEGSGAGFQARLNTLITKYGDEDAAAKTAAAAP